MTMENIRKKIDGNWVEQKKGWIVEISREQLLDAVKNMFSEDARFVALVGKPMTEQEVKAIWYFDVRGQLVGLQSIVSCDKRASSILDIYPGADWAEREFHDYYAVDFEGRKGTLPLVLREGDTPGIMLSKGANS